ncbi:MAG: peptide chain release factor N(5)-glutamine methyltransferase [Gammaproteobacteria bacterium]|nr:peptide chain release factor N(5)-glutamine methyltransferase [Gammaproteobacteria bacterium]
MQNTIAEILRDATEALSQVSETPRLDAEILLAHVLSVSRARLFAYPESKIDISQHVDFTNKITDLLRGVPVAYLTGQKEFWSLNFAVTPDVLIPRPDTELLIELILKIENKSSMRVADLGTGSGAIAIALQYERQHWEIHATDQSQKALEIAKQNAMTHHCESIHFHCGDWCDALPQDQYFDLIVSNPPYIAKNDPHLKALQYEPIDALISEESGLQDLREIILTARHHLKSGGQLFVEHGYEQAESVRAFFHEAGYADVRSFEDLEHRSRVSTGILSHAGENFYEK